jgi:hypothetical protein
MEKKYENQNNIYSVTSIEDSLETFVDNISNTIPNILVPSVSQKTLNVIHLYYSFRVLLLKENVFPTTSKPILK